MIDGLVTLLQGATVTVVVGLVANALGLALGCLVCLMRLSPLRLPRWLAAVYISLFRGVPLLVQLLIIYFFLPAVGLDLAPFVSACIGLGLCSAAYQAENLRGGFLIVPPGLSEAARAFGYTSRQTLSHVLIPQALRAAAPSVLNEILLIVKASSLVSVVGVTDLTRASQNIVARDLKPLVWYFAAGLIYLAINLTLSYVGHVAERRLNVGHVRGSP